MAEIEPSKRQLSLANLDWQDMLLAIVGIILFGPVMAWAGIGNHDGLVLAALTQCPRGPQALRYLAAVDRIYYGIWLLMPVVGLLLYRRPLSCALTRRCLSGCALVVVIGWMFLSRTTSVLFLVTLIAAAQVMGATIAGGLLLSASGRLNCSRAGAAGAAIAGAAIAGGCASLAWSNYFLLRFAGNSMSPMAVWHVAIGAAYLCSLYELRPRHLSAALVDPNGCGLEELGSQLRLWLIFLAWCALAPGLFQGFRLPREQGLFLLSHPLLLSCEISCPTILAGLLYLVASTRLSRSARSRTVLPVGVCLQLLCWSVFGLSWYFANALALGLCCWMGLVFVTTLAEICPPRMAALVFGMAVTVLPASGHAMSALKTLLHHSRWGFGWFLVLLSVLVIVAASALKAVFEPGGVVDAPRDAFGDAALT